MNKDKLAQLRTELIALRNECLGPLEEFDPDGAVILSHTISWMHFKIEGKPFVQESD